MTTVQTRVREISDKEGFDITVKRSGKPISLRRNGVLKPYPFRRKLKDSATVEDWRRERFEATYGGYKCDVLKGDGTIAPGQMKLKALRATY